MRVWELLHDGDNYDYLYPTDEDEEKYYNVELRGKKLLEGWEILNFVVRKKRKRSDIPLLNLSRPIFSKKAVEVLAQFLDGKVELLPIEAEGEKFYILNVLNTIDCLDLEKSIIDKETNPVTGFMLVRVPMFLEEKVMKQGIFKIHRYWTTTYVTDEFREKVLKSGLQGFVFKPIWDSEGAIVEEEPQRYKNMSIEIIKEIKDDVVEDELFGYVLDKCASEGKILDKGVKKMKKGYQMLVSTMMLEGEVLNGGITQYYYNTNGDFDKMVLEGSKELGYTDMEKTMKEIIKICKNEKKKFTEAREKGTWEDFAELYDTIDFGEYAEKIKTQVRELSKMRVAYIYKYPENFID